MADPKSIERDTQTEHRKKLEAAPGFSGPVKNRTCTDVIFLILILVSWAAMSYIGVVAMSKGKVDVLRYGYDWQGNVCKGSTPYFMGVNRLSMGVCVSSCPTTYDPNAAHAYCIGGVLGSQDNVKDGFCIPKYPTQPIMNRCIITNSTASTALNLAERSQGADANYLRSFLQDTYTARGYTFGLGFALSLVLGFIWCWVLRLPGFVFTAIWTICGLIFGFLCALGAVMYNFAETWATAASRTHTNQEIAGARGLAIVCFVCAFLWLCLLLAIRTRINLAILLVKEAARVLIAIPVMMLYPIFQVAGLMLFLVPWAYYSVYMAASGKFKPSTFTGFHQAIRLVGTTPTVIVQRFQYASGAEGAVWYMLFILLWTAQFIIAIGQITVAMTVSQWYFTRDRKTVGNGALFSSMCTTVYHVGTAAFGSLIIAIVEFIRAIVAYIQKKASQAQNRFAEAVLCCCQCCLWCLENVLQFINKSAYIQTAIFGYTFCTAAKKAFFLIARNILRVGAVSLISEFIIIIGKIFIASFAGGICYYAMVFTMEDKLNSPIAPTILVIILAWFTANMFCEIFSMAMTTLLQAFIVDEEMFEPSERHAHSELASFVDQHGNPSNIQAPSAASPKSGPQQQAEYIAKVAV